MKNALNIIGLAIFAFLASVAPSFALGPTAVGRGGGAPAPEIGAGLVGMLLAGAAVKYFRQRGQG